MYFCTMRSEELSESSFHNEKKKTSHLNQQMSAFINSLELHNNWSREKVIKFHVVVSLSS